MLHTLDNLFGLDLVILSPSSRWCGPGEEAFLYERRKNEPEFIIKTTAHRGRGGKELNVSVSPAGFSLTTQALYIEAEPSFGIG